MSKFSYRSLCQFYDEYLVEHYKILNNDRMKRDDIRRHLFIIAFIVLLALQSIFILTPIALSIRRHHHENTPVSSVNKQSNYRLKILLNFSL